MSAQARPVEEFSFTGEEVGIAGGQALTRVQSLIDTAPIGRLFDAIATLSELSMATAQQLEVTSAAPGPANEKRRPRPRPAEPRRPPPPPPPGPASSAPG